MVTRKRQRGRVYEYVTVGFVCSEYTRGLLVGLARVMGLNRSEVLRRLIWEEGRRRKVEVGDGDRDAGAASKDGAGGASGAGG